jgi:hypothetical protein
MVSSVVGLPFAATIISGCLYQCSSEVGSPCRLCGRKRWECFPSHPLQNGFWVEQFMAVSDIMSDLSNSAMVLCAKHKLRKPPCCLAVSSWPKQ